MPTTADHRTLLSRTVSIAPVSIDERVEDDQHVLLWQVHGQTDLMIGQDPRRLAVGTAVWIPAGTRHSFTTHRNSVLLPIVFDATDSVGRTSDAGLRAPTVIAVDGDLRTLFLAFVQSSYSIIKTSTDLTGQILRQLQRADRRSALPMPVTRGASVVAAALKSNPGDQRGVGELAASAHSSIRTIERAFRSETGMTLRRWRIQNRMESASALLRSAAPHTTDAVAHRVGYASTAAFRRVFKDHFGVTPGRYAQRFRGM